MTDPKQQRRKRSLLIDTGFQGRLVLLIFIAGFACIAINSYLYYAYVAGSYDFILKHSSLSKELVDERYRELFQLWASFGLLSFLVLLVIAIYGLIVTHRAAGAIYHINRVIDEIKSGNTNERIHLRKKDEFQDLAKSFNEMMDKLQKP